MDVTWSREQGEWIGAIKGEPDVTLRANEYAWAVLVCGELSREGYVMQQHIARATRKLGREIQRLEWSQAKAVAAAEGILKARAEGGAS